MKFFTSDTHFGHVNIIKYCGRPFKDANEMDEALISYWNARVKPGDDVYHLGDFSFRSPEPYLKRLNGRIHMIWGNHDHHSMRYSKENHKPNFTSVQFYKELHESKRVLMLFHYSMRVWNGSHHGSYHLYGHSHGDLPGIGRSFDIGVDANGYAPVLFEEVRDRLDQLPIFPHHKMAHDRIEEIQ